MRWLLAAALALAPLCAQAQEHHEHFHAYYKDWGNKRDTGCCNNQDCGALRDDNERSTADGIEVRIDGVWCPVKPWHYLKSGNAPDWSSAHVCVRKSYSGMNVSACDRLLCYQPRPGI
jgi:hypothetical protein